MAGSLAAGVDFVKRTGKGEKRFPFHGGRSFLRARRTSGTVVLRLYTGSEQSVRIDDAVRYLAGMEGPLPRDIRIVKTAQYRKTEGGIDLI